MKKQLSPLVYIGLVMAFVALITTQSIAQAPSKPAKTVRASDIMEAIKNRQDISYENVTITGVLDFTYMDEKMPDLPQRRRWWRNGGDNTVNEVIESKINFVNCFFEEDVIAYYHDERSGYTFTADFEKEVVFKNSIFKRDAMFKYSEFERDADFEGVMFKNETTFKYAQFEEKANFANTVFEEDAIFKYTKFRNGVSFNAARFERSLDIKYTKVRGDFDIKDLYVKWDINSKYTDINGRSFSRYMLDR